LKQKHSEKHKTNKTISGKYYFWKSHTLENEDVKKIVFRDFNDKATINNLTNRFCKLHKSVHFFLKAMEDANISYLELDKLIVNDSKLKGLRPGIALSRLLCHSNLHDLIKVVHKVSPDLFQKLGKLLKSDLNQANEKKNVRPDEKSIANWLRVTIPVELQGACRELLISVLLQEKEENCKKLTNQEASFDDKELYREELANLIGLLPTEKQDYYMRRAVDSIDWSNIAHGRMALEGVTRNFSRECSFSKEELTELVDMRHVIDSVDWSDYEKGMKKLQQVTNFFDNHYAKSKSAITNVETKKISKANNQSDSVNNHSMNSSTSSSSSTFWSSASSSSSNQSKTYDEDILKNNFFK